MKILILGKGFLGSHLEREFKKSHEVIIASLDPKDENTIPLDATNKKELESLILSKSPDVVIHTIAISNTVICKENPDLCEKTNYLSATYALEACKKINSSFVFISTSYVLESKRGGYNEEDSRSPFGIYAKYKARAEKAIEDYEKTIIIRTEQMYGINHLTNQLQFGTQNFEDGVNVAYPNVLRKPIFIKDISKAIEFLLEKELYGIFHVAGPQKMKWIEFLKRLARIKNMESKIKLIQPKELSVSPPKDSSLNTSKLESRGFSFTSLKDAIIKISGELK